MKKFLLGLLVGIAITVSSSAFADTTSTKVEAYLKNDLPIYLDGKKVNLNNAPIIYEGNTYLPLRETATIMGKDVQWNEKTQTIELHSEAVPAFGNTTSKSKGDTKTMNENDQKVWYNVDDVESKYPTMFKKYDQDVKAVIDFEGKEYHVKQEGFLSKDGIMYNTKETFLQYLDETRLAEFQTYKIDVDAKVVTPIN